MTLIELLLAMTILTALTAAMVGLFIVQNRVTIQQELVTAMEQNIRIGMSSLMEEFRNAGYGVPKVSMSSWVPWVTGFDTNPRVIQGSGSAPDRLQFARCGPDTILTLTAAAAGPVATNIEQGGATVLNVTSAIAGETVTSLVDTGNKRLIRIGDFEWAHVKAVSSTQITIDTDPAASVSGQANQGVDRYFPVGTPICRIDVFTYDIGTDPDTGVPVLRVDRNQGAGSVPAVEGVEDLQITTVTAGRHYEISLTARTEKNYPVDADPIFRTLTTTVILMN